MQTAFGDRDESWRDRFLEAIDGANLKIASQEVIIGKDGFPYLQLETVEVGENFRAFVIDKELPTILQHGLGIVINARNEGADWVFSYGDIVNLELNDEFYTDDSIFSIRQEHVSLASDEKVLIGQPSDAILPKYLRTQIREFLFHFGVRTPKIMLLARNYEDEQNVTQDLVFNLTPQQFAGKEAFDEVMRTLSWFLPKHYSFFCIDETTIENGFEQI
jgi:hypothetical protein